MSSVRIGATASGDRIYPTTKRNGEIDSSQFSNKETLELKRERNAAGLLNIPLVRPNT
jgi:hypothetical protein